MQKLIATVLVLGLTGSALAQNRLSAREFSINGYRNPSVGVEFRLRHVSVHAGYYPTNFKGGETTDFFKAGFTAWFLPMGKKENPSSFYAGVNYLSGHNNDYEGKNAVGMEAGFRWMVWKGLNIRLGAIAVAGGGESLKLNPASGISYSFFFN